MANESINNAPLIAAHRGYRARFPENTMAAFKAARDLGVPMIELDVTLTKDGHVVVIHDETLDRTSDGKGHVREHTLSQLKKLDAGGWFSPFFRGEKIPTLSDVLDFFKNKTLINIEIKPEAFEPVHHENTIEHKVAALISDLSSPDAIVISSFHPGIVERVAHMDISGLRVSLLTEHEALDDAMLDFMTGINAYSWNPDFQVLTQDQVERAHAKGIRVLTYTVNRASVGKHCFDMGVDGLFTDEPRLFGYSL